MFLTIKNIPSKSWSSEKPLNLKPKFTTFLLLCVGLSLFGLGEGLLLVSTTGNSPWSVLAEGLSNILNISIGLSTFIISIIVLGFWFPLKQKPGIGTILNILIIAAIIDLTLFLFDPPLATFSKYILAVFSVLLVGLGSGIYLIANLGPGPRDGLMTGLTKKNSTSYCFNSSYFGNFSCYIWLVFGRNCWFGYYNICIWHRSCSSFRNLYCG